jgi:hypothetical protein
LSELWDDKAVLMRDYNHSVDGKVPELFYLKAAEDKILPTTIRGKIETNSRCKRGYYSKNND